MSISATLLAQEERAAVEQLETVGAPCAALFHVTLDGVASFAQLADACRVPDILASHVRECGVLCGRCCNRARC